MSQYPHDEHTRVAIVPTISDLAAPSTAELNGGTDITCNLTPDGLTLGIGTNAVSGATLCSRVDSQKAGRVTFSASITTYRETQGVPDPVWDNVDWGEESYVVVRRGLAYDTAWANGQNVEVYKITWGERGPADTAADTNNTVTVPMFVDSYELDAVVGGAS